jgi:polyhydroxybutyrate depolymerase
LKKKLIIVFGVFVFLVGCVALYLLPYRHHLPKTELVIDGVTREYYLFVPSDEASSPSGLIITLQGGDADAGWRFPGQDEWEAIAEKENMIIALPSGYTYGDNEGAWVLNTDATAMQDINFFNQMISDISVRHWVDTSRVYAVGYSLGSMFAYELACHMSESFAAIASVAGTMPLNVKLCEQSRNVPIMHVHGVEDPIIAYGNSWEWKAWDSVGAMRDIPSLVDYWSEKYDCQSKVETIGQVISHFAYSDCAQDARVEHYRLERGAHDWPETLLGQPTSEVMWSFFNHYNLPGKKLRPNSAN